ncbi:radical SAM family heme chaperone HemW [Sphingomonas donggukensis]|uniref:Heme chaperone HemW n=1 Tax=Sphingomonas donggukensis TaxID=2949093 RepID=A0ABY4TRA5_9SPHN|nr:radical SAM family heme chaperone HemW [Sphingomonas donggukensis]URW74767.1 radical SAM family heme chaperone HemW [Sphingomonas donggukensis]
MNAPEPLALYVHWPFCVSKCPYCDFNSHVRDDVDQARFRDALVADLRHEASVLPGRRLGSIFFGGGTPSLMPPHTVAAVLAAAEDAWGFVDDIEITLEANPSSVEAARFGDLAAAGVSRVSLGLQALDDAALAFLGRAHDVREGLAALDTAQAAFARVSFDLIYARPGQSLAAWEGELARAIGFGTEHLSLYQLTIEPGTRFATLAAKGELAIPEGDDAADLFETTQAMTAGAGLPRYEVSNHARVGAESRHNLTYWRYRDYAGIGPGAHGRRGGVATVRHRKPENWLAAVDRNGHGTQSEDVLTAQERASEALVMGLRMTEGIVVDPAFVDLAAVDRLVAQGLLMRDGHHVATTEAGILLLDSILPAIARD